MRRRTHVGDPARAGASVLLPRPLHAGPPVLSQAEPPLLLVIPSPYGADLTACCSRAPALLERAATLRACRSTLEVRCPVRTAQWMSAVILAL